MIIGGGVVGMNAAAVAIGMGATVYIYDRDIDRLRELDVALGSRADTLLRLDARDRGAPARHRSRDRRRARRRGQGAHARDPSELSLMKHQAVLVDVSVDQGGCFETSRATTHADPTYEVDGITHYCVANMPGAVPITSTYALTNATMPYVLSIANHGAVKAVASNPGFKLGVNVASGQVTYAPVADVAGFPYVDVDEALGIAAGAA